MKLSKILGFKINFLSETIKICSTERAVVAFLTEKSF